MGQERWVPVRRRLKPFVKKPLIHSPDQSAPTSPHEPLVLLRIFRLCLSNRRISPGLGGRFDALPLACGYRFRSLGTRRPRPRVSGLWADDVCLRPPLPPPPYPRRPGGVDLQAQPLPRSPLPRTPQDPQPRTRNHHRPTSLADRLGRLLLDRTSTLPPPHGDPPDPVRTPGRLRDHALRRCHREVHPTVSGHPRGAAARRRTPPPTIPRRDRDHPLHRRSPTREGTRDPLRRAGVDPEARLVR